MIQWFLFMVNNMSTRFAKLFASVGNSNKVRIKFKTVEVRGTTFNDDNDDDEGDYSVLKVLSIVIIIRKLMYFQ